MTAGDSLFMSCVEEFVFKLGVGNFADLYVAYLERNDKTVVKVDGSYFKLAKLKSNAAGKKKGNVSLIQMAKQENYNERIENYSNSEIELILSAYFDFFISYFQTDLFGVLLLNQTHRASLKSLVDTVILPPYAKYIFALSDLIKQKIGDLIFFYLKNTLCEEPIIDYDKLNSFLKAFYSNNDIINSQIMQGMFILNFV
jgi:hypothetical protein